MSSKGRVVAFVQQYREKTRPFSQKRYYRIRESVKNPFLYSVGFATIFCLSLYKILYSISLNYHLSASFLFTLHDTIDGESISYCHHRQATGIY